MASIHTDIIRAGREGHTVGTAVWDSFDRRGTQEVYTDADQLIHDLGLDYRVGVAPLINARTGKQAGDHREVYRVNPDGTPGDTLGLVRNRYTIVQGEDFVRPLMQVAAPHGLKVYAGGELSGGARAWLLLKAGEHVFRNRVLANGELDRIEKNLLWVWSHDGSSSCRFAAVPTAFWCANTLASSLAQAKKHEKYWSIPHTKHAHERIALMTRGVVQALRWMDDFTAQMVALEEQRMTTQGMRDFAEQLILDVEGALTPRTQEELGFKKDGSPKADGRIAARERKVTKLVDLFQGEGVSCRGETGLDAFQAVTEFVDHHRRRAEKARTVQQQLDTRFQETLLAKTTQNVRTRALRLLTR